MAGHWHQCGDRGPRVEPGRRQCYAADLSQPGPEARAERTAGGRNQSVPGELPR